jgi:hypothetical protein
MAELRLEKPLNTSIGRMDDLIRGFQGNTFVEKVYLTGSFLNDLAESHCAILFEEIAARLPMLQAFYVSNAAIQVKHFYSVLDLSKTLETLELRHVQLLGTHDDFVEFEFGLHRHPSLRHFILSDFTAPPDTNLDNLIKVLGTIPQIESVEMDAHPDALLAPFALTGSTLMPLCKHITFKELHLSHLALNQLFCNMIAWALVHAKLTDLSLAHCHLDDQNVRVMAKALVCNISLRRLDLSYNDITDDACFALADALGENDCLKQLDVTGCNTMSRQGHEALLTALERNSMLEHLDTPYGKENRAMDRLPKPPRRQRSLILCNGE